MSAFRQQQTKFGFWPAMVCRLLTKADIRKQFADEFMSSRLNRLWLLVLGVSKTRGETRTRPIKVVPKNEKEVGVSH